VSDLLARRVTGETCCSEITVAPAQEPDELASSLASSLASRAAQLRDEARRLEAELAAEGGKVTSETTAPRRPAVRYATIPDSAWTFACTLDGLEENPTAQRRRFSVVAKLRRGDRPGDGESLGDLELVDAPSNLVGRGFAWKVERDLEDNDKALFVRAGLEVVDGALPATDGRTLFLNARVVTDESGALRLEDGTLTVKRQQMTRFLFLEYPSLLAQFKVVGSFKATATELPLGAAPEVVS